MQSHLWRAREVIGAVGEHDTAAEAMLREALATATNAALIAIENGNPPPE